MADYLSENWPPIVALLVCLGGLGFVTKIGLIDGVINQKFKLANRSATGSEAVILGLLVIAFVGSGAMLGIVVSLLRLLQ